MQATAQILDAPYAAVAAVRAAWREPVEVLSAFADEVWAIGFLSGGGGADGRWSYLARQPDAALVCVPRDGGDPFVALAEMVGPASPRLADGPPFQGGAAGLAAYELGDHVEALGLGRHPAWPDLACARYPAVLAFDHERRETLAIGRGRDEAEARHAAKRALAWLDLTPVAAHPGRLAEPLSASSGSAYETAVAEVVARIGHGEIFQANIARRWAGRLKPGRRPFDLLARLARTSAAPFAAYLRLADRALVSNSPERFLRVSPDGGVETRPIKGTRPRGRDATEDAALVAELAASPKDRAENLMIVDLMRNDLARACAPGTVATPALCRVTSFANVHHLVSTVTGRLAAGRTAIDLFRAAFPPGSITGAPKVQAMKTIAVLEPPRGPFFGALFWAGFDGAFDSSVLIRTAGFCAEAGGWRLEARAGAGIVADSDPHEERLETEAKIGALVGALTNEQNASLLPLREKDPRGRVGYDGAALKKDGLCMAEARLIDGRAFAAGLVARVADEVAALQRDHGIKPGLAVVLVGEDPGSQIYVRNKGEQTLAAGMHSLTIRLPNTTSQDELLKVVADLNTDPAIHGILVQFPVPAHIDPLVIQAAVDPQKDVDGLNVINIGRLASGQPGLVACTPLGCLMLLEDALGGRAALRGRRAVVVGRSNLVGKPIAQLLLKADCTVTIAHSRTVDLPSVTREADILVAAVAQPEMIRGDWIKPGAAVIDVGINRVPSRRPKAAAAGKTIVVGDVAFEEAKTVAGWITPVPGGVGPMTVACLLQNTLTAARRQAGLTD